MLKRIFDIVAATAGLLVLCPLLIWIAWRIKFEDRGPVFYRGVRVGMYGRLFRIFKFRSMVVNADRIGPSSTPSEDPRITCIGRWIRAHKLDELPQLFNVLAGDMSFVGPRPQVKWAVDLYTPYEQLILSVRPGITDFASMKFANEGELLKNASDPDKSYLELIHPVKTELALKYVKTRSFILDINLILQTIFHIFNKQKDLANHEKISNIR